MPNRMPGFTADVALSGSGGMYYRLQPMGAVAHREVLPMMRKGDGQGDSTACYQSCLAGCSRGDTQCNKDCIDGCWPAQATGNQPPPPFQFKNPNAGFACCSNDYLLCAVACVGLMGYPPAAAVCELGCAIWNLTCQAGMQAPCNSL